MKRCRQEKFATTCAFAALYADQTVVFNPLNEIIYDLQHFPDAEVEVHGELAGELQFYVAHIVAAMPLVAAGILKFIEPSIGRVCDACFSKLLGEASTDELPVFPFVEAYSSYLDLSKVNFRGVDRSGSDHLELYEVSSGPYWEDHPAIFCKPLGSSSRLLGRKLDEGEILEREDIHKLSLFRQTASFGAADLIAKSLTSEKYGFGSILSNNLELRVMNSVFREDFLRKSFSFDFPIIAAANYEQVLKIRESDWAIFESFRGLFLEFLPSPDVSDQEIEETYRKKILLEAIKLEALLDTARRKSRDALIDEAATSFLTFTGAGLAAASAVNYLSLAAGVLGGGHFARNMVPVLRELATEPPEIKQSRMYYAWKIRKTLS